MKIPSGEIGPRRISRVACAEPQVQCIPCTRNPQSHRQPRCCAKIALGGKKLPTLQQSRSSDRNTLKATTTRQLAPRRNQQNRANPLEVPQRMDQVAHSCVAKCQVSLTPEVHKRDACLEWGRKERKALFRVAPPPAAAQRVPGPTNRTT